jgi:hypothetical protein
MGFDFSKTPHINGRLESILGIVGSGCIYRHLCICLRIEKNAQYEQIKDVSFHRIGY